MVKRFYIVEGEIEEAFFVYLRQNDFILPGKIKKFNLMQKDISPGEDFRSSRNSEFICIIDTDVMTNNTPNHLIKNLKILLKVVDSPKKVKLLAQNQNFEDELCRVLQCSKNFLPERINPKIKELKDCKQKLANMRPENYSRLLNGDSLRRIPQTYCANPPDDIRDILEKNRLSGLLTEPPKIFHPK